MTSGQVPMSAGAIKYQGKLEDLSEEKEKQHFNFVL
jgi:hypothetical protein